MTLPPTYPSNASTVNDCLNASVDQWAAEHLQPILDSAAYTSRNTAVMVYYDEDHPVRARSAMVAAPGPRHDTLP